MGMSDNIDQSAIITNSICGVIKIFRNVVINDSTMGDGTSIGDDTTVERSVFEEHVLVNRRCYVNDSYIGRYTYMGINTTMNCTKIGRYCSIGRNADIGGFNHDYQKVTTLPIFRFQQMVGGGGKLQGFEAKEELCEIGNDVWIAAGAHILHDVKIGDGAVIGAGAVVTHDVPPYAIVVGVPAKVIGYRCEQKYIDMFAKIKWWNWPEEIVAQTMSKMADWDIGEESMEYMLKVYESLRKNEGE